MTKQNFPYTQKYLFSISARSTVLNKHLSRKKHFKATVSNITVNLTFEQNPQFKKPTNSLALVQNHFIEQI